MRKNSSISNFKLPGAFTAALILCLILRFGDLLLPVNTFTHRLWEALIVHQVSSLPGPFYPNQKISMREQGDLAPYTKFSVRKEVSWETNDAGYRKSISAEEKYPIVIVGDSTTLGTGLDQPDTLSEQLERMLGKKVYPFAPYYQMDTYLHSPFYANNPPEQVIFSMMEWALPDLIEKVPDQPHKEKLPGFLVNERVSILLDRASKLSFMRFLNARMKGLFKSTLIKPSFQTTETAEGWMIFPKGKSAHPEISLEKIDAILPVLTHYQQELRQRGIKMFFLPVPNKESLYYDLIPGRPAPVFYTTLVKAAEAADIPTLDLLKIYTRARSQNPRLLYHLDDSHWNRYGVELAAQEIVRWTENNGTGS